MYGSTEYITIALESVKKVELKPMSRFDNKKKVIDFLSLVEHAK
jgi:hypothetical protein